MFISSKGNSKLLESYARNGRMGLFALFLLLLTTHTASASESGGINWSITPYIWATDTEYDLKASGTPVDTGKITFDDLLDTTDSSFQIVTEAGIEGGKWSAFVDLTYLDTSDDYTGSLFKVDSDSEQWFLDAAVAWWPKGESGGLSLFAGGRYTDLEDQLDFRLTANGQQLWLLDNDRDFLDALVGVRQQFSLSDSWKLHAHADYSFGDSEGTYPVSYTHLTLPTRCHRCSSRWWGALL